MNALTQHFARRRKTLYVTAGLVMAVLLGVGGALAGSALFGSAPSSSSGSAATAATLNAALSSSPSATATSPAAKARRAAVLVRLRRLGGMYGQASFRGKDGSTVTYAYERGTVVSADGSQSTGSAVVKAANGTTLTWKYESNTVVHKGGQKVSISDVANGEKVLVAGPITAGSRDARVIIIAAPKSTTPAPAPSSTGGTSSS
ncbi:MAG TPA: hypothetical protein VHW06_15115 [Streptosporangiaceae bacterium]|nr:hypothetical protein [Streptosporangiaceae bacterium]